MAAVTELSDCPLHEGLLREPLGAGQGLALWRPGGRTARCQEWERIRSVPRAEFCLETGIGAVPATILRARQTLGSFWSKLRWHTGSAEPWTLPNGASAEPYGERQDDAVLVWVESDNFYLDEAWLRQRWPQATAVQQIGPRLFLVSGVPQQATATATELANVEGCPRQQAEQALALARREGKRRAEATALTDLGLIELTPQTAVRGVRLLEEALAIARSLTDRALQADILVNLGRASLLAGQSQAAVNQLQEAVALARALGDRFLEKLALERLGLAYRRLGERPRCLAAFQEALTLAQQLGHRKHEADVCWLLGICHAEVGEREQATAQAQAAVEVMERAGNPRAAWFAEHLRRYRFNESAEELASSGPAEATAQLFGETWVATSAAARPAATAPGPGLLQMALTATQAMAKFLGSGMKTVARAELEQRLRTCTACPHHTGVRCRLCGCFTNVKARLPHEECPLQKW